MDIIEKTMTNDKLNNAVKVLCAAALIIMISMCGGLYHAQIGRLAVFALYIVFYVQIPGLYILDLFSLKFSHISTKLCLGLFTGWSLIIIQYFITELIGTNILLYVAGPVLSVLYIVFVSVPALRGKKGKAFGGFSFNRMSGAFAVFAVMALAYSLLYTQYLYMAPDTCDFTYLNADRGFHMGLIETLSHGWPMESPWVNGITFNYHIFTEMMYSVPVRLFGLSVDTVLVTCGPFMTVYTFSLSLYTVLREMCRNTDKTGLYCLAVMLANLYITRSSTNSLAFLFIFRNENASGYGISAAFALMVALKYWYNAYSSGQPSRRYFIVLAAFMMLLTGIKGPMGLVMIGAVWGTCLLGMILRKVPGKTLVPVLVLSVCFLLIYVVILGMKGQSNGGGTSIFAFATIANIAYYKSALIAFMKRFGIPKIIRLAVVLVVFLAFFFTAFFVPFCAGYIRELCLVLTGRKKFDFPAVTVYAVVLLGMVFLFIFNYSGHSQVYFGLLALLFSPVIAFRFLEDMSGNKSAWMRLVRIAFAVCLVISTMTLAGHYQKLADGAVDALDTHKTYDTYLSISKDEYNAMKWIESNTPYDSLLATDRYYSVSLDEYDVKDRWKNRFFLYSIYSNRFCYLEGSGYNIPDDKWELRRDMLEKNSALYDSANARRGDDARELGVDYVIVSKRFTDAGNLSGKGYELCFSNDDIDIYQVTDRAAD